LRRPERATRRDILLVGDARLGPADDAVRAQLAAVTDLARLKRMLRETATAANWQQILDTP
jgi:hypothetical protein